jgi:hypothetical protein
MISVSVDGPVRAETSTWSASRLQRFRASAHSRSRSGTDFAGERIHTSARASCRASRSAWRFSYDPLSHTKRFASAICRSARGRAVSGVSQIPLIIAVRDGPSRAAIRSNRALMSVAPLLLGEPFRRCSRRGAR